jgi:hypothetical protein
MNIQDIATQNGIIFNRSSGNILQLPYSDFEAIKIQPNDIVTESVINSVIEKLYDNYLYIYKSTRIASNVIPVSAIGFAGVLSGTNNMSWYTATSSLSTGSFISFTNAPNLTGIDNIRTMVTGTNKDLGQHVIFASTGSDIIIFESSNTYSSITLTLSTNTTYQGSNNYFKGINSLTLDSVNNVLYVVDLSANNIHKFDVSGLLTNNSVLSGRIVYQNSIGGFGTYDDPLQFNRPIGTAIYDSTLYVVDSNNSCIKQYDTNFNWIITHRLFRDLLSVDPVDISTDTFGNIYILTSNNSIIKYDNSFTTKTDISLGSLSADGEFFKKIVFSSSNSNIFYIVSNLYVYKKLVDTPQNTVGKYLLNRFNVNKNERITAFASEAVGGSDNNLIFSTLSGIGKFSLYYDNLDSLDIIGNINFDIYTIDSIYIKNEEYVQNWVFNKMIAKLLANHMRLRDQFLGKFLYKDDTATGATYVTLQGIRYILPEEAQTINFQQDVSYFIGSNEIFQNAILNRSFKKIFDIQTALINILQEDIQVDVDINTPVYID